MTVGNNGFEIIKVNINCKTSKDVYFGLKIIKNDLLSNDIEQFWFLKRNCLRKSSFSDKTI